MIKRLFRTWLRIKMYKKIGEYTNFEECFLWVYNSPILEWDLRFYCVICSFTGYHVEVKGRDKLLYKGDLSKASRVWDFLHK